MSHEYSHPTSTVSPGSDTATTPTYDGSDSGKKLSRRSVACKSCHGLKVKCTPSNINNPSSPCVRCLNANRKCEIDLNQTRKRRKKAEIMSEKNALLNKENSVVPNNARGTASATEDEPEDTVSKLQNKIKMLEVQLEQQQNQQPPKKFAMAEMPRFFSKTDLEGEIHMLSDISSKLTDLTNELKSVADRRSFLLKDGKSPDLITHNIITIEEARERLHIYKTKIFASHPLVEVPDNVTVEELQETQPFLLNSIMSVSNALYDNSKDVDKSLILDNFALQTITVEVLVLGTKSDELIKSLLLLCLWYNTPELFRHRRYHLLNTISVTMLHDLGIISRPSYSYKNADGAITVNRKSFGNSEYRSLVLILYFTTVSICLILRRTIYVKWTPYVEECCKYLESTNVQRWVELALFSRLSNLLDKIHHVLHSPDVSERRSSLYIISEFQNLLIVFRKQIRDDDYPCLAYYYSVEAYLHEPVLGGVISDEGDGLTINKKSVKSILHCTQASLNALKMFNKLTPEQVATIPLFTSSRVTYTAGMLLRLRYLIISFPTHVEKELVPREALVEVQRTNNLIHESSIAHASNHFLKKTRLVMQLFIQTYATQVLELLSRSNGPLGSTDGRPGESNGVDKLVRILDPRQNRTKTVHSDDEEVFNSPIPLDILSYAATYRRDGTLQFKDDTLDLPACEAIHRLDSMPQSPMERLRKAGVATKSSSPGSLAHTPKPGSTPVPKHIPALNERHSPLPPIASMHSTDPAPIAASLSNGMQPNLRKTSISGAPGISFPSRAFQSYPPIQAHQPQFPPLTQFQGLPLALRRGLFQPPHGIPAIHGIPTHGMPPVPIQPPPNQYDTQQLQGPANNLKGFNSNLANADQLENSYWALNDEFWVDLLSTESDRINFSSNNYNNSQANEEVFFMN